MSREKVMKKIADRTALMNYRNSRVRILITAFTLSLFLLLSVILYLSFGEALRKPNSQVITEENIETILNQISENADATDNSFEAIMNYTWLFENGNAVSANAYVENSSNNQNSFYFTVALTDTSQTVLYVSPTLAVGESINDIRLKTTLAAGTYDAALTYNLLDKSGNTADTVQMAVTIIIEQ